VKRFVFLLPLILFVAIAAYFAVGLTRDPSKLPSVLLNKPVPTFRLPPLEGRTPPDSHGFASDDLKGGELALVNVFASWCLPCRAEHPLLMRLAREKGVTVHGINYKDEPGDATTWLNRFGDPYARIGVDRDGRASIDWGVYGVPETFIVDGKGVIRYRHVGPMTPTDIEQTILPLIEKLGG
jgi:cytochrome c biogenesis protein CcmG/thiol:disulfide interchange protein DsbE